MECLEASVQGEVVWATSPATNPSSVGNDQKGYGDKKPRELKSRGAKRIVWPGERRQANRGKLSPAQSTVPAVVVDV